jgi:hypothetical protein
MTPREAEIGNEVGRSRGSADSAGKTGCLDKHERAMRQLACSNLAAESRGEASELTWAAVLGGSPSLVRHGGAEPHKRDFTPCSGKGHEPIKCSAWRGILANPWTLGFLSWWTTWGLSDGVLDAGQGVGGGGASG